MSNIRRNDPCPCGSGKKYKKCCMNGIFETTGVSVKPAMAKDSEWKYMPCTVELTAIPKNVDLNWVIAQKFKRNLLLHQSGYKPSPEERQRLIDEIERIFSSYNKIQLLGALGLHLIYVIAIRNDVLQDEEIEPILEYAMSFAFASSKNAAAAPTDKVVKELYRKLLLLKRSYNDGELVQSMGTSNPRDLLNHTAFINVRGDGYPRHLEEVFNEYFALHQDFLSQHYAGATLVDLQNLLQHIERRIVVRITDNSMYGCKTMHMLWEQWKKWDEENEKIDPKTGFPIFNEAYKDPITGPYLAANPDIPQEDGQMIIHICNDYENAEKIFSLIPHNEAERAILDACSCQLGDNAAFMEGEYRGAIMSYENIVRKKPFLKYNGKYYCFSILLPYRRMFDIAAELLRIDENYYQFHFLGNEFYECKDNYVERKVRQLLADKFLDVQFYPSVHYIGESGEMDILGVSQDATYLIEVKADQLTDRYRGGTTGIEKELRDYVGKGAKQSLRSLNYIQSRKNPIFTCAGESNIRVVKEAPSYRICVTLEHYGGLVCSVRGLVEMGIVEEEHRDIWIVSIYDLMAILENIADAKAFNKYLSIRNEMAKDDDVIFNDELDAFGLFLTNPTKLSERPLVVPHSYILDAKYNGVVM